MWQGEGVSDRVRVWQAGLGCGRQGEGVAGRVRVWQAG